MEPLKKPHQGAREVPTTNLGLYVWLMPNGKIMGDDEGNYLNIPSVKGDRDKIANISRIAHNLLRDNGVPEEGVAYFMPGRRRVNDEELEEQKMRMTSGLVPDEYDVASMKETLAAEKKHNR